MIHRNGVFMDFKEILYKIMENKYLKDYGPFDLPVGIQKKILNEFEEPTDNYKRSYYQYVCQSKLRSRFKHIILNIVSIPLLLYYWFKPNDKLNVTEENIKADVFYPDGKPLNIVPVDLINKDKLRVCNIKKEYMDEFDKEFLLSLIKMFPCSPLFLVKCLIKIRCYSYEIHRGYTKSIMTCNEYSFTSSVLTEYCQKRGISHINIMHGEKLFYIRDAFFSYHRCIVWDKYYADLFITLRAAPNQFVIALPESMKFRSVHNEELYSDYTYYLGAEEENAIKRICRILLQLSLKSKVVIRPHPRYTDINSLKSLSKGIEIESNNDICIEESVMRTRNVISLYSTVLNQALCNGKSIIIDDITNKSKYEKLLYLNYYILNKNYKCLSEIVEISKGDKINFVNKMVK